MAGEIPASHARRKGQCWEPRSSRQEAAESPSSLNRKFCRAMPWTTRSHFTAGHAVIQQLHRCLLKVPSSWCYPGILHIRTAEKHWCMRGGGNKSPFSLCDSFPIISAFPLTLPTARCKWTTKKWSRDSNDLSAFWRSDKCTELWNLLNFKYKISIFFHSF